MLDRRVAVDELKTHLSSTGHLVDVARRPDGAGWDAAGGHTPYVILWPQPTIPIPTMSGAHRGDTTVVQATCVANDPDLAMRVAEDIIGLFLDPPATLDGRSVVDVRIVTSGGPDRDPNDERLFFCIVLPAIQTFA